jgi:hypothetical protein
MSTRALGKPLRSVQDARPGVVLVDPGNGVRVRIAEVTPGALIGDGPYAGQPLADAITFTVEPVDQLVGWARPAGAQSGGFEWLSGAYQVVLPEKHADWDTVDWFEHYVASEIPERDRAAVCRVWLGDQT